MTLPIPWTVDDILAATGGDLLGEHSGRRFAGVCIDSRKCGTDQVFVAIVGQRHDAHRFLDDVIEAGVRCVVIGKAMASDLPVSDWTEKGAAAVAVDDTTRALGAMAAYQRNRAGVPLVAITGSNGKTTTKEMTAAVAAQKYKVLSTAGNLNNEIGLPLTLLQLSSDHEAAVVELGMNHPGEIGRLSAICTPEIGLITNIGPAHLEGVGSIDAVAAAKAEMLPWIKPAGTAVINADDAFGGWLAARSERNVMFFGMGKDAHVRAEDIVQKDGRTEFELILPDAAVRVVLNVYWRFMVYNALAASAVGHLLGVSPDAIGRGIGRFKAVRGRMSVYMTPFKAYVIDDTYNANPGSMETAIRSLAALGDRKRGILVAGDMLELGETAATLHENIGRVAARAGINRIYLSGQYAAQVAQGARSGGMKGSDIFVGTKEDIVKDLTGYLTAGDWVLVKGSRSTGMDEIVDRLTAKAKIHGSDATSAEPV